MPERYKKTPSGYAIVHNKPGESFRVTGKWALITYVSLGVHITRHRFDLHKIVLQTTPLLSCCCDGRPFVTHRECLTSRVIGSNPTVKRPSTVLWIGNKRGVFFVFFCSNSSIHKKTFAVQKLGLRLYSWCLTVSCGRKRIPR